MSGGAMSIGRYFTEMLDPSMNWDDVAEMVRQWNGQFCLKGIMSVADAKRAVEIGCTGIVLSNHGGRQLDGSRAAFDQLAEIVDAVGDRIDVIMDGGIQRGTHVLKALSLGRQSRWRRPLLSLSSRRGRPGRRRAGARPDAGGDRARHEADGLHDRSTSFHAKICGSDNSASPHHAKKYREPAMTYTPAPRDPKATPVRINLLSDTQTRPTPAMREAMARAEVGDEQIGDDPTVNLLCERVADLLGKEAAVFMPSGTMCNVAATLVHCRPGDEILAHESAHIIAREGGAHAALGGFQITPLKGDDGQFSPETFRAALHPRTPLPAAADRGQRRADRQYRRRHDLEEGRAR